MANKLTKLQRTLILTAIDDTIFWYVNCNTYNDLINRLRGALKFAGFGQVEIVHERPTEVDHELMINVSGVIFRKNFVKKTGRIKRLEKLKK